MTAVAPGVPELVFNDAPHQQCLLATCPKDVTEDDAAVIFDYSLQIW